MAHERGCRCGWCQPRSHRPLPPLNDEQRRELLAVVQRDGYAILHYTLPDPDPNSKEQP